ncbi:MAG: N-acetyltransferase [Candidatus Thiodiazotropha sp.]
MKLALCKKSDTAEIKQLFKQVFSDSEGEAEGVLIANLAADLLNTTEPQDIFGYLATEQDQIIGAIFFTRLSFDAPVEAFILAPVAVKTSHQRKGIGQKLINFGIDQMKKKGVKLLFTYGDPNYYSQLGFQSIMENIAKAPLKLSQPEGWLCQSLTGDEFVPIPGNSKCVTALNKPEYW